MGDWISKTAWASTTALGMIFSAPAFADTEPSGNGASTNGDIIVTARRVEERLQDVPISITVMNQSQLESHNVVAAEDLARTTPSLQANDMFGADNTTFSIRGFTQDIGSAPTVGVYFGDVVAPRSGGFSTPSGDGAGPGSFFDLQSVEVAKGPQGTLQGRNTTGGSVSLVPQKPTHKLEGYVEGSVGDFGMIGVQAVLNVPLNDALRVRFGIDRQKRNGYIINDSGIGPHDFGNTDNTSMRLSIVADLSPDLENYTIASYSNSNNNGNVQKVIAAGPGEYESFALDQLQRQAGLGFYGMLSDQSDSNTKTRQWQIINSTTWTASDTLTIKNIISFAEYRQQLQDPQFGTDFQVNSASELYQFLQYYQATAAAAGYGAFFPNPQSLPNVVSTVNSLIGSTFNYSNINPNPGHDFSSESTFTEELRFQGRGLDDRLNWQGGFYFEKESPIGLAGAQSINSQNCIGITTATPICSSPLAIALNAYQPFAFFTLSGGYNPSLYANHLQDTAVYAQATYKITSKISITGGFRYTWDKQTVSDDPNFYGYSDNPGGMPIPTAYCANTAMVAPATGCGVTYSTKSSRPTWLIDLDWKPVDNVLAYAKYARGYRAGGVKPDVVQSIYDTANGATYNTGSWKPEKVDAYEVGLKLSFNGAVSGIVNLAGFYNDFNDEQVQLGISAIAAPVPGQSTIFNAAKSRSYGLELDTSLNLFRGFVFNADYTYLNTKVEAVNIVGGPLYTVGSSLFYVVPLAVAGQPSTYSPRNKFSLNGEYTLPLDSRIGKVSIGATFTHTDSQHTTYSDTGTTTTTVLANGATVSSTADLGMLAPTNLLDFDASWKGVDGTPLDLSFFMTNVTGEKYYTGVPGVLGLGFEVASLGAPRMWGFRAKVHF